MNQKGILSHFEQVNESDSFLLFQIGREVYENLTREKECCVCFENKANQQSMRCDHFVCLKCLLSLKKDECPLCRHTIDPDWLEPDLYAVFRENIEKEEEKRRQEQLELDNYVAQRIDVELNGVNTIFNALFGNTATLNWGEMMDSVLTTSTADHLEPEGRTGTNNTIVFFFDNEMEDSSGNDGDNEDEDFEDNDDTNSPTSRGDNSNSSDSDDDSENEEQHGEIPPPANRRPHRRDRDGDGPNGQGPASFYRRIDSIFDELD